MATKHLIKLIPVLVLLGALFLPILTARATTLPDPIQNAPLAVSGAPDETIILAGGCFWGVEAVFEHLLGVKNVVSGYAGGDAATAQYGTVSSGTTGHAESVLITYDPSKITLGQILKVFFAIAHNPTQLNYQGPDHGTQYRSAIFVGNDAQKKIVTDYIAQLDAAKVFSDKIVTQVNDAQTFYPAEEHHQNFMKLNPMHPYILAHDAPKLAAFKKELPTLFVAD